MKTHLHLFFLIAVSAATANLAFADPKIRDVDVDVRESVELTPAIYASEHAKIDASDSAMTLSSVGKLFKETDKAGDLMLWIDENGLPLTVRRSGDFILVETEYGTTARIERRTVSGVLIEPQPAVSLGLALD